VRSRPAVAVYALGGTIASIPGAAPGAAPGLTAEELIAAVPALEGVADLSATSFRQVPSPELTLSDLGALVERAGVDVEGGAAGVVATQGTDTLEESAFVLDLLWNLDAPFVLTAAMRNPGLPGADGPANLLAAVRVAASPATRGLGCVAVLNDEIHAARFVRKTHATSPATFRSWAGGPLGWVAEDRVRVASRPVRPPVEGLPAAADLEGAPVALLRVTLGDDGRLLDAVESLGYRGLVVEATGGGHVPRGWAEPLGRLARSLPVVLASRTGAGEVLRSTYGFVGSEIDLLERGLIPAGALDGPKARLLVALLLAGGASHAAVKEAFAQIG
jgi:L-asparaginase